MTQTQRRLIDRAAFEWADELYELRDIDGDKIGDVMEANPDYLVVETDGGFLGLGERRLYYVPVRAINRDPEGHYRVSIDKDDAESMAWGQPPSESTWSASEWRAQLRSDYPAYDEERRDATRLIRWDEDLQATTTDQQVGEVVARQETSVRVPVMEEQVEVRKVARPVEEIEVTKTPVQETREVQDTVRREEFQVEDTSPAKRS